VEVEVELVTALGVDVIIVGVVIKALTGNDAAVGTTLEINFDVKTVLKLEGVLELKNPSK
jgi:hypothetical protein